METLRHDDVLLQYPDVIKSMQEKYENIKGVAVEITQADNEIKLLYAGNDLFMTSEQAVDLMRELRRAIVKVNPKALRKKNKK